MLCPSRFIAAAALALSLAACSPPQQAPDSDTASRAETGAGTQAGTPLVAEGPTLVITAPVAGARVASPLIVEGSAPGDWYFEAQFPARLIGADGAVLAEGPAIAQDNWMTEAPVPYRAELQFNVTQETQATLVLQEDMPADNRSPRQVTIPVVLAPAS